MDNERVRQIYRDQGWGVIAEEQGLDPLNVEAQARMAYQTMWDERLKAKAPAMNNPRIVVSAHPWLSHHGARYAEAQIALVSDEGSSVPICAGRVRADDEHAPALLAGQVFTVARAMIAAAIFANPKAPAPAYSYDETCRILDDELRRGL